MESNIKSLQKSGNVDGWTKNVIGEIREMKTLFLVLTHKPLLLAAIFWGIIEVAFFPKPMLLFFLAGSMVIDLLCGLMKSWKNGVATNAELFQKTVLKITRYVSVTIAVWILVNILNGMSPSSFDYSFFVNSCIGFLSFIELYSIFENVYEIDPAGPLSKYFVGPILKFLKGRLKNNPINQLENNEDTKKDETK